MFRTTFAALAMGATALSSTAALAQDWRAELPVLRVGLLGGENDADRLRDNACLEEDLEELLGIPVELFPAPDYAGVMQGLLADQLDYAQLGASAYAGIYLQDPDAVEPLFVSAESDGSTGYFSVMYTRADSGITSLEDMQGRSLAFADPNSTSGYLVPRAELTRQGIDLETYFSQTGFGGGHEQAVVAVLQGQYDAGVTWVSGVGEPSEGYTRGNLRSMIDNGLLNMDDLRIIWQSSQIPNGPIVVRQGIPEEARTIIIDYLDTLLQDDPACYYSTTAGEGQGFVAVDHEFFVPVVEMRRMETGSR
ncbi:phosphonate ABC transporter substrate-binding protein [Roseicyclus sp.]|uniref:phosphonate ABC transporter substrate-binding protein n=1 Tax=Roseicyclus sp. TaxID=1914329 RepID=UPI003F9FDE03